MCSKKKTSVKCVALILAMALISGCGSATGDNHISSQNNVQAILEKQMAAEDEKKAAADESAAEAPESDAGADDATVGENKNEQPAGDVESVKDSTAGAVADNSGETDNTGSAGNETSDTQSADDNQTADNESSEEVNTEADKVTVSSDGTVIDVDLTVLSSTMVYSEVVNMMYNPGTYMDKRVKMDGIQSVYTDPSTGITYYACVVQDATACCAQGIEYVLKDGIEYPEMGSEVTVEGIFETYTEEHDGKTYLYFHLKDSEIIKNE